jgi:hypothetical protein
MAVIGLRRNPVAERREVNGGNRWASAVEVVARGAVVAMGRLVRRRRDSGARRRRREEFEGRGVGRRSIRERSDRVMVRRWIWQSNGRDYACLSDASAVLGIKTTTINFLISRD